eukprot:Pgem_evm1s5330
MLVVNIGLDMETFHIKGFIKFDRLQIIKRFLYLMQVGIEATFEPGRAEVGAFIESEIDIGHTQFVLAGQMDVNLETQSLGGKLELMKSVIDPFGLHFLEVDAAMFEIEIDEFGVPTLINLDGDILLGDTKLPKIQRNEEKLFLHVEPVDPAASMAMLFEIRNFQWNSIMHDVFEINNWPQFLNFGFDKLQLTYNPTPFDYTISSATEGGMVIPSGYSFELDGFHYLFIKGLNVFMQVSETSAEFRGSMKPLSIGGFMELT